MTGKNKNWSRRDFMKMAGAAGVGAVVSPMEHLASAVVISESEVSAPRYVPTRPFGRSGVDISILTLGGTVNFLRYQLFLKQALKMGVTCWDTSRNYIGGKSEKGIGKYFNKFPEDRKKVFLVTKTGHSDPDNMMQHLYESLQRMKTAYIDLFLIQAVSNVKKEINNDIQAWAKQAKAQGKIRFFGFSTHKNMENCLADATKLGWIDGIMATYNYRLMHTDRMKKAVDACTEAGIGLIAMKTQASFVAEAIADAVPISDIMRYLMYYCNYGDQQHAIQLFKELPSDTRKRISQVNYSKAEQRCPQRMPIAQLMRVALAKLEC